jgi:hypothetical protein
MGGRGEPEVVLFKKEIPKTTAARYKMNFTWRVFKVNVEKSRQAFLDNNISFAKLNRYIGST